MTSNLHKRLEFKYRRWDKNGRETTNDKEAVAKELTSNRTDRVQLLLLSDGHGLYDVQNNEHNYRTSRTWKFIKVTDVIFNLYIKYLTTRKQTFRTLAERKL